MDPALKKKLNTLKHYLSNLPDTLHLPEPGLAIYNSIDDGNDWLDEQRRLDPATVGVEQRTFTLGGCTDIDLSSSYLSDADIVSQAQAETANALRRDPGSSSGVTKPPPARTDCDSWE
ncbi:hypothetical protein BS17DRAFT_362133 [Gyrodon lividus]|nr:hypothetical protein BS17DRAFT_362133 [Gyrodon lividus]